MRREKILDVVRDGGLRRWGLRANVLGGGVRGGAVDIHSRFPWAASHATLEDDAVGVEAGNLLDSAFNVMQIHSLAPVDIKHSDEDIVDLC